MDQIRKLAAKQALIGKPGTNPAATAPKDAAVVPKTPAAGKAPNDAKSPKKDKQKKGTNSKPAKSSKPTKEKTSVETVKKTPAPQAAAARPDLSEVISQKFDESIRKLGTELKELLGTRLDSMPADRSVPAPPTPSSVVVAGDGAPTAIPPLEPVPLQAFSVEAADAWMKAYKLPASAADMRNWSDRSHLPFKEVSVTLAGRNPHGLLAAYRTAATVWAIFYLIKRGHRSIDFQFYNTRDQKICKNFDAFMANKGIENPMIFRFIGSTVTAGDLTRRNTIDPDSRGTSAIFVDIYHDNVNDGDKGFSSQTYCAYGYPDLLWIAHPFRGFYGTADTAVWVRTPENQIRWLSDDVNAAYHGHPACDDMHLQAGDGTYARTTAKVWSLGTNNVIYNAILVSQSSVIQKMQDPTPASQGWLKTTIRDYGIFGGWEKFLPSSLVAQLPCKTVSVLINYSHLVETRRHLAGKGRSNWTFANFQEAVNHILGQDSAYTRAEMAFPQTFINYRRDLSLAAFTFSAQEDAERLAGARDGNAEALSTFDAERRNINVPREEYFSPYYVAAAALAAIVFYLKYIRKSNVALSATRLQDGPGRVDYSGLSRPALVSLNILCPIIEELGKRAVPDKYRPLMSLLIAYCDMWQIKPDNGAWWLVFFVQFAKHTFLARLKLRTAIIVHAVHNCLVTSQPLVREVSLAYDSVSGLIPNRLRATLHSWIDRGFNRVGKALQNVQVGIDELTPRPVTQVIVGGSYAMASTGGLVTALAALALKGEPPGPEVTMVNPGLGKRTVREFDDHYYMADSEPIHNLNDERRVWASIDVDTYSFVPSIDCRPVVPQDLDEHIAIEGDLAILWTCAKREDDPSGYYRIIFHNAPMYQPAKSGTNMAAVAQFRLLRDTPKAEANIWDFAYNAFRNGGYAVGPCSQCNVSAFFRTDLPSSILLQDWHPLTIADLFEAPLDETEANFLRSETKRIGSRMMELDQRTFEDWLKHTDSSKRPRYEASWKSIETDPITGPRDKRVRQITVNIKRDEVLLKSRLAVEKNGFIPRPIHAVDPALTVTIGPYIYEATRIAKLIFNTGSFGRIGDWIVTLRFAAGATDEDLSRWFSEAMAPHHHGHSSIYIFVAGDDSLVVVRYKDKIRILTGDLSQCDHTIRLEALLAEWRVLKDLGVPKFILELMEANARATCICGTAQMGAPGVRVYRPHERNTGGTDTTLGNTLDVMMVWHAVTLALTPEGLFFVMEAVIEEQFKTFGLDLKLRSHEGLHEQWETALPPPEFLKGWWTLRSDTDEYPPWIWGPLPSRLLKVAKTISDPRITFRRQKGRQSLEKALNCQLASVSKGILPFSHIHELSLIYGRWAGLADVEPKPYEETHPFSIKVGNLEPTFPKDGIHWVVRRYGGQVEEWKEFFAALSQALPGTVFFHPCWLLLSKDYM